jgi:hypothetical protein
VATGAQWPLLHVLSGAQERQDGKDTAVLIR